jgi:hypothetical protein
MAFEVSNSYEAVVLYKHQPVWRSATAFAIALTLQIATDLPAKAQDPHLGIIEYEISCMPCHGLDGRGDGPRAKFLKTAPSDLTRIAKLNKGEFPAKKLAEIIDGRAIVGDHGQRDMPVWGDRYRVPAEANERNSAIERRARTQISALVEYLRTIQEK